MKTAYFNADLEKDIYPKKIPYGDKNFDTNKFWLFKKALYGLKQAGKNVK